jgi:hypothetical protein
LRSRIPPDWCALANAGIIEPPALVARVLALVDVRASIARASAFGDDPRLHRAARSKVCKNSHVFAAVIPQNNGAQS